ncbi:gas vesicle structural protein GvpA [Streptomyces sp. SID14478]|uniref:gas vesicle protein GvpJ n=1 Tax=Streptomyces sp. SID14478 TaxID=2706073 RepID=UPI0013E0DE87|nr:gas vesicle protein GvpJ [Streptomyces sp. SID14478]NEB81952.1 gas vesicle structural protein GvpA [Streptomyces sp. SID14478]
MTTTYSEDVVACAPRAGTLYDVLELILDRGMVIDVFVRVSLVGIEILKIDARIVIASVDTYLRFAEACNRLDLEHDTRSKTVPELFGGGGAAAAVGKAGAKKAARSVGDKVKDTLGLDSGSDDDDDSDSDYEEREPSRSRRSASPRSRPASRSSRRPRSPRRDDEDD